jgi:large subunit ribosomal protein L23
MKDPLDIVVCPVITEKGTALKERNGQYLFKVAKISNKIEIKRAVEKIYKVKVEKVNTLTVRGKTKRMRMSRGRTPDWKKAVVTLQEGESIEFI